MRMLQYANMEEELFVSTQLMLHIEIGPHTHIFVNELCCVE